MSSDLPVLPELLAALGIGAAIGKILVWRLERRSGRELSSAQTRRIEAAWMTSLGALALVLSIVSELK